MEGERGEEVERKREAKGVVAKRARGKGTRERERETEGREEKGTYALQQTLC